MSSRALAELLHGKGAHADPVACVEDLSAELAARQVAGFPHSIGQLVFHMNYWMDYELRRIRGEGPAYPEHASESFSLAPSPADAQDWDRQCKCFASLLADFTALSKSSTEELQRRIETAHEGDTKLAGTLEAVLWQMVAHNSYHTGQIAMIRRVFGAWPRVAAGIPGKKRRVRQKSQPDRSASLSVILRADSWHFHALRLLHSGTYRSSAQARGGIQTAGPRARTARRCPR